MKTNSKKKMGYLLVRIRDGFNWADVNKEDNEILEILKFHQLIEADPMAIINGVCRITGKGREILLNNEKGDVVNGEYLLPGELAWYDTFPWKLLFPGLISIVVAIATSAITILVFKR